jgi:hypothetical protein
MFGMFSLKPSDSRLPSLDGILIGQVWLIKGRSLDAYLRNGWMVRDRRYGRRGVDAASNQEVIR